MKDRKRMRAARERKGGPENSSLEEIGRGWIFTSNKNKHRRFRMLGINLVWGTRSDNGTNQRMNSTLE